MVDNPTIEDKQIEAAIWYVRHKALLRKVVLGLIIGLDAAFLVYALLGAGSDLISLPDRKKQEFELIRSDIAQTVMASGTGPQDLELGGVDLLRSGGMVDVLARVRNPNPEWYVKFEYIIGLDENTEKASGFLLPKEERPFFRTLRGRGNGTVVFNIENVSWRRITPRDTPDFEKFRDEHLNFEIKNAQFTPGSADGKGSLSRAEFTVINQTAYNYAEPKFLVLLYRGSRLIGIQSAVVDNDKSGESRRVELSWINHIGAVSNIEVVPEIDIMDSSVYMQTQ